MRKYSKFDFLSKILTIRSVIHFYFALKFFLKIGIGRIDFPHIIIKHEIKAKNNAEKKTRKINKQKTTKYKKPNKINKYLKRP